MRYIDLEVIHIRYIDVGRYRHNNEAFMQKFTYQIL